MKMNTRIVVLVLAIVVAFSCTGIAYALTMNESKDTEISIDATEVVKHNSATLVPQEFTVERINEFIDEDLDTYSLEDLTALIEAERENQRIAHELAENARVLRWPETSTAIEHAENVWWNAQVKINAYRAQYDKLYEEQGLAKWEAKKVEYPAATEIWLYMKELGWNDYVCAGIMGNIMSEVGGRTLDLNPMLYSYGNKYYYGICQWNKSAYGEIHGANLATQLNFLRDTIKYEMDTYGYAFRKSFNLDSFLQLTNERDAALAFAKCYERCASSDYTARQNNAEVAYDYFVNN